MHRIISVTSGKGGVGKTTIALNLALLFSKVSNTLLFDGDLGLGNVEILLGVQIPKTLENVFKRECAIQEIIFKYKNLSILSGGSGVAKIADLEDDKRTELINKLLSIGDYDNIIIDTSPGIGKNVMQFLEVSNDIIIVTNTELPGIIDSYQLIKTLSLKSRGKNVGIVVNQASSKKIADEKAHVLLNNCKKFLKMDINYLGYINTHVSIKIAVNEQIPFTIKDTNGFTTSQLRNIFYSTYKKDMNKKEIKSFEKLLKTEVVDVTRGY